MFTANANKMDVLLYLSEMNKCTLTQASQVMDKFETEAESSAAAIEVCEFESD